MIKTFLQFINESMDIKIEFINNLSKNLIHKLRTSSFDESDTYSVFSGMHFNSPFNFNLVLNVRFDSNLDIEKDDHFKSLSWEQTNYLNLGYAIDANTHMSKSTSKIPKIVLHIIINPKNEPSLYTNLYYRFIDILNHETNHLNQLGVNREPFNTQVSHMDTRNGSKKSYKYFLLPDEVESMIEGMYVRSKEEDRYLDEVFSDYLSPFIKNKYITRSEYQKVMKTWITRSLELYPDAKFSKKADSIIENI